MPARTLRVRIGFSVAIAGVIALAAKDLGKRVRARRGADAERDS